MFGRMTVDRLLNVSPGCKSCDAVKALLKLAEAATVTKWIEFPNSVLVFVSIPGDRNSGAIYFLDCTLGVWYWIDFEDSQYGGYSLAELEQLLSECGLLRLVERPGLLRGDLRWELHRGKEPISTNLSCLD